MSTREQPPAPFVLVAWLWAWFLSSTHALHPMPHGSILSSLAPTYTNTSFSPSPTSGSCGKCGIEAPGGIRLVYWEPDNAIKNGSNINLTQNLAQAYTQVDNGFTYTSPSVYVIYSSLRATATCSDSALHTVGPSFSEKTLAYSSRFLAYGTLSMPDAGCSEFVVVGGFHTIDFSSLYYNPITTTTTYKAGCAPYANPRLSLPAELTNVDPSWQSCEPLFYGAFDPPSVLSKVSGGLVPSPVGAGQITNTPSADTNPEPVNPAQPVVTPGPPIAAPTNDPPINNGPPPSNVPPGVPNPAPAHPAPANPVPGNPTPAAPGNPVMGSSPVNIPHPPDESALAPAANGSPVNSGLSLGNLINSPFKGGAGNVAASPASPGNPAAVAANPGAPASSPALVAVPVDTGDGKPAYAVVAAQPNPVGGSESPVAAMPFTGASPVDHAPVVAGQSTPGGSGNAAAPGGSGSGASGDGAGSHSAQGPDGTTKVTLSDGTTADIPTANIIEPGPPQGNNAPAGVPPSNFQSVHLSAGAFVAVPNESGPPSSIMVQGGDYFVPKPTADVPQQIITLQGGQLFTVPIDQPGPLTLQGGQVTSVAANVPPQVLTLHNGKVSTVSKTAVTLANGQVTIVPVAAPAVGSGGDNSNLPLQILTLAGGKVTTVPIGIPDQTATLQGGKITTIPANAPSQVITLANGQISTISSTTPYTTVTLANGKVTAIPMSISNSDSDTTQDSDSGSDFIDIPDATISGIVHYTHLPIVKIQNINNATTGLNGTGSGSGLNGPPSSSSPMQTANNTAPPLITPTASGNIAGASVGATGSNTSSGTRLSVPRTKSRRIVGLCVLGLVMWLYCLEGWIDFVT